MVRADLVEIAQTSPATSDTLTIATYNIHVGIPMGHDFGKYTVTDPDLQNIADVITSTSADVIGLQEVDCEFGFTLPLSRRRTCAINEPRRLAALTDMHYAFGSAQDDFKYPSDNAAYVEWGTANHWFNNGGRHGEVGNAILSSHRFSAPANIPLPVENGKERRSCLRAVLSPEGTLAKYPPIVFYVTHLQHDSAHSRVEQLSTILRYARLEQPDSFVFVIGDLNHISPGSPRRADETTATELLDIVVQNGFCDLVALHAADTKTSPAMTFPANAPDRRIDYILANRPLEVLEAKVITSMASDHLPVVVTVRMPDLTGLAKEQTEDTHD